MIPNILTIAGSDPSGGAGIQADIKAISANGGYAMAAITALTVQNTQGVRRVQLVDPDLVSEQIEAVLEDVSVDAVKLGVLGSAAIVRVVAKALRKVERPVVLDPVMVAKSGDRLLDAEAVAALREELLPLCAIATPNLPEAADLLGIPEAVDRSGMEKQAARLLALGPRAVLLKGGHLSGQESPDLFAAANDMTWLEGARVDTGNTHGTGCTLSSALATLLALGHHPLAASREAKRYIARALAGANALTVGRGHGPVDHFPMLRTQQ